VSFLLQLSGPTAHRVYQRDDKDTADIPFGVALPSEARGRVEARTVPGAWTTVGWASEGDFSAVLLAVPVGEHTVQVRCVSQGDGKVLAEGEAGPVFVGDLWVLGGQSNMEGCGRLIEIEEPQSGVSCFYMGDRWDLAQEPLCWLIESSDPVHWRNLPYLPQGTEITDENRQAFREAYRQDRVQGTGLGIPFGKMLLRHTGIPVGLLMVAHGGTSMNQWDSKLASEGSRSLYGAMLRIIQAAGGKVKGFLWYQGESDAEEAESKVYYDRMIRWVASLRRDLGDSELPFIYAQLSVVFNGPPEGPWNRVQDDQLRLESALGRAEMVPTIDTVLADWIHPDSRSLRDIGHRMAWAALRLVHGREPVQSGPRLVASHWNEDRTRLTLDLTGINGRLRPVERVFSFQIASGENRLPLTGYLDDSGLRVILRLEGPAPEDCRLWHGRGLNPTVNVRDEQGIPLPVFGPVEV